MTRKAIPFLLPGIAWTLLFTVIPLLYTTYLSFFDYSVLRPAVYVGLENYQRLFSEPTYWSILRLTLLYAVAATMVSMLVGVFAAWVFSHDSLPIVRTLRTLFGAPLLLAPVAAGAIAALFFNPNINTALDINMLGNPSQASFAIFLVDVWRWIPLTCLTIIVLLNQLPRDDHLSFRQTLSRLSAPLGILALFRLIEGLKLFDLIVIMTGGGPARATNNLAYFIYENSFREFRLGYGAAIAVVLMILSLVPLWGIWRLSRRLWTEQS